MVLKNESVVVIPLKEYEALTEKLRFLKENRKRNCVYLTKNDVYCLPNDGSKDIDILVGEIKKLSTELNETRLKLDKKELELYYSQNKSFWKRLFGS